MPRLGLPELILLTVVVVIIFLLTRQRQTRD